MTPPPWKVWTALGTVYVVWGSTYLAIVYVVRTMPPLLSAGLRFTAAAALLAAYLLLRRGRSAFAAPRRSLLNGVGIGLLLLLGGNGLVTLGEQRHLPSGLTALLVAGVPFWVVVLRWATGDRPAPRTVVGVLLGFCGVAVLLLPGSRPQGVTLVAALLVVGSSLVWSLGSFLATRVSLPADPLLTTLAEMAGGAVGLLVAGLASGEVLAPARFSVASWVGLAYLVVFGSLVAFTAFSWLLGVAPVSQVSTYAYVNPVVAVLLGALFVRERVTPTTAVGGAVTVLAVAVVVSAEGRRRRPAVEGPAVGPGERRVEPALRGPTSGTGAGAAR